MTRSVLSNCYVPITCNDESTLTSSSLIGIHNNKPFRCLTQQEVSEVSHNGDDKNVQPSTRTRETLRPLVLETSWVLSSSSTASSLSSSSPVVGSSLVEWGLTKVIAQLSLITDGSCLVDTGTLVVRVDATLPSRLTSGRLFDGSITDGVKVSSRTGNHSSSATAISNALSLELESQIHRAILPSLNLKLYPKTILQLDLTLIQNDGSVLSACILASTLALADAQIELYDLVTCCQSVIVKDHQNDDYTIDNVWVDPESTEEHYSTSNISLAILGQTQEVTFWRQQQQQQQQEETNVSKIELQTKESNIDQTRTISSNPMLNEEAIRLCRDGCRTLYKFVKQHLREKEEERCHQRQEKR